MAIGLLFIAVAVLALFTPAQPDTFWHLRAGADIWRSGHVPRVDLYSHTAYGTPWPDHEWLSQLLMYAAYRAGRGMPGLELGAAALILAAAAVVYKTMVGPRLTRFVLLTVGLAIASCAWSMRPQLLTLFLLALLVWLLVRDRQLFLIPPYFLALGQRARRRGAGGRGAGGLHGGRGLALVAHAGAGRPAPRPNLGRRVAAGGAGRRGDTARVSHLSIRGRLGGALLRRADRGVVRPPSRLALRPALLGRDDRLRHPDRRAPARDRRR